MPEKIPHSYFRPIYSQIPNIQDQKIRIQHDIVYPTNCGVKIIVVDMPNPRIAQYKIISEIIC